MKYCCAGLISLVALAFWECPLGVAGLSDEVVVLQGIVTIRPHEGAIVKHGLKRIRVTSKEEELRQIFEDERISGRQMKLIGHYRSDELFEVEEFFVVREGSLYRLVYFCDT